jgi:hypothetical protein
MRLLPAVNALKPVSTTILPPFFARTMGLPLSQLHLHHPAVRGVGALSLFLLSIHFFLSFSSPTYHGTVETARAKLGLGSATDADTWYQGRVRPSGWTPAGPGMRVDVDAEQDSAGAVTNSSRRANAAFVVLARNSDLWELLSSIRGMEGESGARAT